MIPKEILQKIRRIQISTSRIATDVFTGQYKSVFKGRGMEFEEVRQYLPGDDIRSIDWNVTARIGQPYVKKFVEEREMTVMFMVDLSLSTKFGTVGQLKAQLGAEICSVMAFSAIRSNDKVGLIIFTDKVEKFVPARKGVRHLLRIIREILYFKPEGKGTDIPLALEYFNKVTRGHSVVFIISDFLTGDFKKPLAIVNKKHDLVAITITDHRETELPAAGVIELVDAETGNVFFVDTSQRQVREQFKKKAAALLEKRKKIFSSVNADNIEIYTGRPYINELVKFFKMRQRRMK